MNAADIGACLDDILLGDAFESASESQEEQLESARRLIMTVYCEIHGHEYLFDMCGHWQHQHCGNCGAPKHPEISELNIKQLVKTMER